MATKEEKRAPQEGEVGFSFTADPPQGPTIHERMVAILADLPAIGKDAYNQQQSFHYRSHDDVLNALNPLLAKHGVFVVPHVLKRVTAQRTTRSGGVMYEVNLHVQYTFYGATGDSVAASAWGEGTDSGDKSTNKAMTMAFKNVLAQVFAVSTADTIDADAHTPEETVKPFDAETDLMAGAISGNDAPKLIVAALNELEPSIVWGDVIVQAVQHTYGQDDWRKLTAEMQKDFWRRLSNATCWMQNVCPPGSFPPISKEQIQAGFAFAFSGMVVEVAHHEPAPLSQEQAAAADKVPDDIPLGPGSGDVD